MATIYIPFRVLDLIFEVQFMVINGSTLMLLSRRDMIINGLDPSIQKYHIRFKDKVQKLEMHNVFLIQKWSHHDTAFPL